MKPGARTVLRVVAVGNLVFFAVGLLFALPVYVTEYRILRDWPATEATVVRSEVVKVATSSGQDVYDTAIQFAYRVNGRNYFSVITSPHQSTSFERKKKQADRFPAGSRHLIRYNPADPKDIRAQVGYNVHYFAVPVFITGVAVLFAILALSFFLLSRAHSTRRGVGAVAG